MIEGELGTEVASRMARALNRPSLEPEITGTYRAGDTRHCFADITLARKLLGYTPEIRLEDGIEELASWLEGQGAAERAVAAPMGAARVG